MCDRLLGVYKVIVGDVLQRFDTFKSWPAKGGALGSFGGATSPCAASAR